MARRRDERDPSRNDERRRSRASNLRARVRLIFAFVSRTTLPAGWTASPIVKAPGSLALICLFEYATYWAYGSYGSTTGWSEEQPARTGLVIGALGGSDAKLEDLSPAGGIVVFQT